MILKRSIFLLYYTLQVYSTNILKIKLYLNVNAKFEHVAFPEERKNFTIVKWLF